ncbi:MAG: M23 family metallopeptidase [Butyricicoccus sp.]|nr:M23 family metallopeptidase [Butyricicoccus sp.]MBQ8586222.1 M23 family metallopeptidase [Butyricicoccus sp.]
MKKMKLNVRALTADAGFYIILLICLSVICISGYVLFFTGTGEDSGVALVTPTVGEPLFTVPSGEAVVTDVPQEPIVKEEEQTEPLAPVLAEETVTEAAAEELPPIWIRPVSGEILRPFTTDSLLYDETMGDWRTHEGVDYAAESGTRVYAIGDGTVQAITNDDLYGTQLTLALKDGRIAAYRGLAEKVKVREGASVRAGDVIGTVGDQADPSEAALGSHLHLAVMDGDRYVDPEAVLSGEAHISSAETGSDEKPVIGIDDSVPQDGIFSEE